MTSPTPLVSLSVVSHGQGHIVRHLLHDLRSLVDVTHEIILTINIPEDTGFLAEFADLPITLIRNAAAKGFGANHNAAFVRSAGACFAVVNPDIRAPGLRMQPLLETIATLRAGACAPAVHSPQGTLEDSARRFPSLSGLFSRTVLKRRGPDYCWTDEPQPVDWVAGMFVVFRREAFAQIGGFDERFFMYLEDVDICRRLLQRGWPTVVQPAVTVVHDARRASHRSLQHLRWHVTSVVRYLTGL
jgi:N-acetylglucosaminyl-diphospho-decaprenol L-rhamnosyltransferase